MYNNMAKEIRSKDISNKLEDITVEILIENDPAV